MAWFAYQLFATEPVSTEPVSDETLNLAVLHTGIHAISPADVRSLSGVNLANWQAQPVAITLQGEPVPFTIKDNQLIFFGRAQDSIYSHKRVYQLLLGDAATGKSRRFTTTNGAADSGQTPLTTITRLTTFEEDNRYVSIARTDAWVDTWYWDQIHVSDFFQFEANLPYVADGSATMTSHLFGVSHDSKVENDHDLDLLINGQLIDQILWDGNKHVVTELELPAGGLKSGNNEIIFDNRQEGNTFIDISEVDWVSFAYRSEPIAAEGLIHFNSDAGKLELSGFSGEPVVLKLDENQEPTLIEATEFKRKTATIMLEQTGEYFAAGPDGWLLPDSITAVPQLTQDGALEKSGRQIDLIILTDAELAPELAPLIEARRQQGLSVKLIETEEIYNRFGHGQPSPQAIQNYLADALKNWPKPAPRYLLLAGGTTYDFRNNLGTQARNRIPSILVEVTHSGETVSDTRLADIDNDGRADISVGRWPATTPQEIASLVERTLAYEKSISAKNVLFTADGTSTEFSSTADRLIANSNLDQLTPNRAYGASWQTVTDYWNSGNWIVTYVGHGSVDLWGQDEVLSGERVAGLQNPANTAPPIVLQFTCLSGFFAHPEQVSISERMLLSPNGPVITVSASSLTYSSSQEPFAASMLEGLTDPNMVRVGDVVAQARADLDISSPSIKEVYDTFNLLGDPSAIVVRP